MTRQQQIGLLANLPRVQAQQAIQRGEYDPADYERVYALFLAAYGDEQLAQRAKSNALECYVERQTNAAARGRR